VSTIDCEVAEVVNCEDFSAQGSGLPWIKGTFRDTHPSRLSIGWDGTAASDQSKRVPVKTPGHAWGTDTVGDTPFVQSGCNTGKFAFVSHWNCHGREDTLPQRAVRSGPRVPTPVVRVRVELAGRPMEAHLVAEGKTGKAATRVGVCVQSWPWSSRRCKWETLPTTRRRCNTRIYIWVRRPKVAQTF